MSVSGEVHVFGDPDPAETLDQVSGHYCDEPDCLSRPATQAEVIYHRESVPVGREWVCLKCGETTTENDS